MEYILMLSRDEEEKRRRSSPPRQDDGVFMADFDDSPTPSTGSRSPPKKNRSPRSQPRATPSSSNAKVQVSPRFQPEPMEAGMGISPISREGSLPGSVSTSLRNQVHVASPSNADFPSISSTPTNSPGAGTPVRRSISGSPKSVRSAWGTTPSRMAKAKSEAPSTSPPQRASSGASVSSSLGRSLATGPSSPSRQRNMPSGLSMSRTTAGRDVSSRGQTMAMTTAQANEREAEDLKFAIELSLAEARSRGEHV